MFPTNVPPELSVRRRFCDAWMTLRIGDDVGGGIEFPEALRLWMKSVRADMSGLFMGEDIWRPRDDDGGVGPPKSFSPWALVLWRSRRRLRKMMRRASKTPRAIAGKRVAKTAVVGNFLGCAVSWFGDCPLEIPDAGAGVVEVVAITIEEVLCGADVDIETVDNDEATPAVVLLVGWPALEDLACFVASLIRHENWP